jgi:hypothetical protein
MSTVPQSTAPCKQAAKFYVKDLGLAVVPLNGKIPNAKKWEDGHICTESQVDAIFKNSHNVGIVTGRYAHDDQPNLTRVWVLDVDWKEEYVLPDDAPEGAEPARVPPTWGDDGRPVRTEGTTLVKNGYEALDEMLAQHGPLPPTWVVRTGGGGTHYYFVIPQGMTISGTAGLRKHIDVRADRGQCAAPPSVHPETKQDYEWHCTGDHIAETPAWLLDIVTEKDRKNAERAEAARAAAAARKAQTPAGGNASQEASREHALRCLALAADDVRKAEEGTRHDMLVRKTVYISKLYGGRGILSDEEIEETMTQSGLDSGLEPGEVENAVIYGMNKGEQGRDAAYPVTPVNNLAAGQAFMSAVISNITGNGGGTTPPPPPSPPPGGGGGNGGGAPPPPGPGAPPPAAGAATPRAATMPTSRNPAYPVDPTTFMAMSRLPDTWTNGIRTRFGAPKGILANITVVLRMDPSWQNHFWLNEMTGFIMYSPPVPLGQVRTSRQFSDADAVRVVCILNEQYDIAVSVENVHHAVTLAADSNKRNPLQEYLRSLTWDGVNRIDTWLQTYMGVEDTPLYRKMGRKWLIAAVARALDPGCKADAMLIVKGPQNAGKSTAFKALAGTEYFSCTPFEMDSKDRFDFLRGVWLYEIAELSNFTRADANALKGFLSSQVDKYRPPYMRVVAEFPRRVLFCGTTNDDQFLTDPTGTRRFWVVESQPIVDVSGILTVRDQLWAEACIAFAQGEEYWLDRTDEAARAADADRYSLHDPLLQATAMYCNNPNNDKFTASSIWEFITEDKKKPTTGDARRIGKLVTEVGTHVYAKYYLPNGTQVRGYVRKGVSTAKPTTFKP